MEAVSCGVLFFLAFHESFSIYLLLLSYSLRGFNLAYSSSFMHLCLFSLFDAFHSRVQWKTKNLYIELIACHETISL